MKFGWQQIPSPVVSEILCHNFDGVVLDTEHACFNRETLASCIQVIKLSKKKAFVRLTEVLNTEIRHCLDSGVDGLIFSTVEKVKQCEKIIDYCFYAPKGQRGLGLVRQNFWGRKNLIHPPPIIVAQIETKKAVKNLSSIVEYSFDYYLIGPYDLSLSLGQPGNFENKEFINSLKTIEETIPSKKLAVHIPTDIKKQVKKYCNYGLICLGMDTLSILEHSNGILKDVKF